jgi:AraC-like DNA-binding protein
MKSWSTEAVPGPEQFDYWREVVCEAFAALDPRPLESGVSFSSRADLSEMGAVNVARIRSGAQTVVRGFAQIRHDPQDRLFVNLQLAGHGFVRQGHREAKVMPGSFTVVDIARPYTLHFEGRFELLSFRIPRHLLLPLVSDPNGLMARPLGGLNGTGFVAASFMRSLADAGAESFAAQAAERMSVHLCELISETARGPGAGGDFGAEPSQASRQALVRVVKAYILGALGSHDLGAEALARRFNVSPRYLHKAFAQEPSSLAAWIRLQRFERCASDLGNPQDRRSVSAIASRWGFQDIPNFTKSFGMRYGCSPSEYRRRASAFRRVRSAET